MSQKEVAQSSGPQTASSTRPDPSAEDTEQSSGIMGLIQTQDWLQNQLLEYKTQLMATDDEPSPPADPEVILEKMGKLHVGLQKASSEHKLQELILKRVQQQEVMIKHLFPDQDSMDTEDGTPEQQGQQTPQHRILTELLSKQSALVSDILKTHKENQEKRKAVDGLQRENLGLKHNIRELMYNLQTVKAAREQTLHENSQDSSLARAEENLRRITEKTVLVRHLFQALILGSGVNWANDPDLTKLVLELGHPLDQQT